MLARPVVLAVGARMVNAQRCWARLVRIGGWGLLR